MAFGAAGKILRIDLSRSDVSVESPGEDFYRLYPGGKALGAYILLREVPPHTEPFSPNNKLVLANGLLTGAPFSTATRFSALARSPLTLGYGESEAGGYWGPELRMAGYDAIVVEGRAPGPVYIEIRDSQVKIHDARHLWGKDTGQAESSIREEMNEKLARVLQIGIGGENLVRYAAIVHDLRHYNGRTGMGAVMGSKNLKAIAVRGSGKYLDYAYDPREVAALGRALAGRVKQHPQSWDLQDKGTPGLVDGLNASGILPTRNFHQGAFERVDEIKWAVYEKELLTARRSCYACAIRCKREVEVHDRYTVSGEYGGPEYETIAGFGSNCGISDLQAVALANEVCGRYALDAISTSATIAFAMECYEHGLIGPQETEGIELKFGNTQAMLTTIDLIAHRRGIGNLLAEGVKRAAESIGGDARYFALHVKGQELPMHDPRGKVGLALGYAVSESGADHLTAPHDPMLANPESVSFKGAAPLGVKPVPPRDFGPEKVRNYAILENWTSAGKALGLCFFGPAPRSFIGVEEVVGAVRAATGWEVTADDVLRLGERATNLARVFNVRNGFTREQDELPERLFQPLENGTLQGVALSRDEFRQAMDELYRLKGWDPEIGVPTRERLRALGIEWAADLPEV